jgi:protein-tyrosine-phosphatase
MKKHIVFVCNGNIHRSVIAAECLRNILKEQKIGSEFSVDSYGIQGTMNTAIPKHKKLSEYPEEWEAAKPALTQFSIDISKHNSQMISEDIVEQAHAIITMDNKVYSLAKNSLTKQFPTYTKKMHRFSELTANHRAIKDPSGSGDKELHKKII